MPGKGRGGRGAQGGGRGGHAHNTRGVGRSQATPKATTPKPKKANPTPTPAVNVNSKAFKDAVAKAVEAAVPAIIEQVKASEQEVSEEAMIVEDVVDQHLEHFASPTTPQVYSNAGEIDDNLFSSAPVDIETGIPLDYHITGKVRELITSHSYVDFTTLLKKDNDAPKARSFSLKVHNDEVLLQSQFENVQQSQSINLWISQFSIYSTIMLRAHPEQAIPLFHYLEHIRSLLTTGYDWAKYDQMFRKLHATNPTQYPFNRDLPTLMLKCQMKTHSSEPQKKFDNKRPSTSQSDQWPKKDRLEPPFPLGHCWTFQRGEFCSGCKWREGHKCCYCGGAHPGIKCSKRSQGSTTSQSDSKQTRQGRDFQPKAKSTPPSSQNRSRSQ